MRAIELKNVTFSYDGKTKILDSVNFTAEYGKVSLISGHSGEGKSTLMYIISGIIPNITYGELSGEVKINDEDIKGKKMTIMGAGGAATAIQVQAALDGAREISIFNKKDAFFEKAQKTVESIKKEVPDCIVNLFDIDDTETLYAEIATSDILTNATLIGMKPYDNETNIKDTSVFRKDLVVTDVVYNPIKTKMILDAEEAGCKVIGGKGMLLYQGVEAFKLFMECEMPVEEVKAKYYSDL